MTNNVKKSVLDSVSKAQAFTDPYPYFLLKDVLPADMVSELLALPFPSPELGGKSGTREVHNKSRSYFDQRSCEQFDCCRALADTLQDPEVISAVENVFGTNLTDTYLRIEYGQDTDGFWLEPHTDIGVKKFTMLLYLSDSEGHETLGTSIYSDKDTHVGNTPFQPNLAMIFVPSDVTWHGFEKRPISGVRKSVIINYVTQEWRAREQLSFPDKVVRQG